MHSSAYLSYYYGVQPLKIRYQHHHCLLCNVWHSRLGWRPTRLHETKDEILTIKFVDSTTQSTPQVGEAFLISAIVQVTLAQILQIDPTLQVSSCLWRLDRWLSFCLHDRVISISSLMHSIIERVWGLMRSKWARNMYEAAREARRGKGGHLADD